MVLRAPPLSGGRRGKFVLVIVPVGGGPCGTGVKEGKERKTAKVWNDER